jgi:histidinol-phosphate aminotransferase
MKLAGMSDYPSKDRAEELTVMLAQMNKVESKNITLFPGTIAAIESIASATLKTGSTIACADPGWSVFEKHMGMRKYKLNKVSFKPTREKALLEELGEEALKGGVDMIYLTSPQFPSGRSLDAVDVETLMEVVPQNVIVIIDQCYLEYAKKGAFNAAALVKQHRNLVVTRSLSKFYGLASIRISYTISDPEVATALYLYNHTNPFLSNYMVDAAMSTLKDDEFHKRVYKHNESEKKRIIDVLKGKGVDVVPGSDANYILAKVEEDTHFTDVILRLHKNGYKSFQHRLYFGKYYQVMISSKEANDMQVSVLP